MNVVIILVKICPCEHLSTNYKCSSKNVNLSMCKISTWVRTTKASIKNGKTEVSPYLDQNVDTWFHLRGKYGGLQFICDLTDRKLSEIVSLVKNVSEPILVTVLE